jgi:tRNA A-37 threonylcarbamoyl transferase component Bud32
MAQPERLGKYDIVEVLGKGAMGVVFKGFDPDIDRTVAIKTVRKELIEEEDRAGMALARFKNEARAAGRLSHTGIVAVYDYGESGSIAYIAMEFVQGNSLREYFNRGTRFAERDAISVMVQLLDALQHAHDQGVWHRDIKPANMIIMTSGKVKIADFGIARIDTSTLTQTGVVMGSPGYMAPEQYAGGKVDRRADLFAAGVVMYQLLTGARPFAGSVESIPYKICHVEPPLPSEAEPDRGWERYNAVITRALAKKPEDRFQTADEFRAGILEAYAKPVAATVSEETIIAEATTGAGMLFEPSSPSARTHPDVTGGSLGSLTGGGTPGPTGTRGGMRTSGTRAGTHANTQGIAPPRSNRTLWFVGAGAAAVALLGVGVGMMLRPTAGPAPSPQAAVAPPAAKPVATPAPAAPPTAVPAQTGPTAAPAPPAPKAEPVVTHEPERKLAPPPAAKPTSPPPERKVTAAPPASKPAAVEHKEIVAAPPPPKPDARGGFWRDQLLTAKVQAKLQFNRRLWDGSGGIQVAVRSGVATLTGAVPSREDIAEAERIAAAVDGVTSVRNELRVGAPAQYQSGSTN